MQIPGMIDFTSGLEAKDNVEQNILGEAHQFIQKDLIDPGERKQGELDAVKLGAQFKSQPGFTEAQRAYNSTGQPVAASMINSDINNTYSNYYQQEVQSGLGPNSLESFHKKVMGYESQTLNGIDPALEAEARRSSDAAGKVWGEKLTLEQSRVNSAVSSQATWQSMSQNENNALSNASVAGYDIYSKSSPANKLYNNASASLGYNSKALISTLQLSGPRAASLNLNFHQKIAESAVEGEIKRRISAAQNAPNTPYTAQYKNELNKSAFKVLSDVKSNPNFNGLNRARLEQVASQTLKPYITANKASQSVLNEDWKNAIADRLQGNALPNDQLIQMQQQSGNMAAFKMSGYNAAGNISNTLKSIEFAPRGQQQQALDKGPTFDDSVLPSDKATYSKTFKTSLMQMLKSQHEDPSLTSHDQLKATQSLEPILTGLASQSDRLAVGGVINNPMLLATVNLSPIAKQAYAKVNGMVLSSESERGLNQSLLSKSQANDMATQINAMPIDQQAQTINGLLRNVNEQSQGIMLKDLTRAHLNPSVLPLSRLNAIRVPNQLVLHNVMANANAGPKGENLNFQNTDTSYAETQHNIFGINKKNPLPAAILSTNFMSTFHQGQRKSQSPWTTGWADTMTNLTGHFVQKGETIDNATNDAYNASIGQHYNVQSITRGNTSALVRVPKQVNVNGSIISIDPNRVNVLGAHIVKELPNIIDMHNRSTAYNLQLQKLGYVSEKQRVQHYTQDVLQGRWVSADDDSFYYVDKNGIKVLNKKGSTIGFNVKDTLPGRLLDHLEAKNPDAHLSNNALAGIN